MSNLTRRPVVFPARLSEGGVWEVLIIPAAPWVRCPSARDARLIALADRVVYGARFERLAARMPKLVAAVAAALDLCTPGSLAARLLRHRLAAP